MDAQAVANLYKVVEESWKMAGRKGRPRLVCSTYYALGANAAEKGGAYIRDYYAFLGPMADNVAKGILSTPSAVRNAVKSYSEIGADELVLWPCIAEIGQVELASEFLG
jgi:hypothetical protein